MSRTTPRCSADGLLSYLALHVLTESPLLHLPFIVFVSIFAMTRGQEPHYSCGQFIPVTSSTPQSFQTPQFQNFTRCIWVFESSHINTVHLRIRFQGVKNSDGTCQRVQAWDGDKKNAMFLWVCNNTSEDVISTQRWFRVLFVAEGFSAAGVLRVEYKASNRTPVQSALFTVCAHYEFECPQTKLCISYSDVCDDFDDCGCGKPFICDEKNCEPSHIDLSATILAALAMALALAVPVVTVGMFLERRHNWAHLSRQPTSMRRTSVVTSQQRKKTIFPDTPKLSSVQRPTIISSGTRQYIEEAVMGSRRNPIHAADTSRLAVPLPH